MIEMDQRLSPKTRFLAELILRLYCLLVIRSRIVLQLNQPITLILV